MRHVAEHREYQYPAAGDVPPKAGGVVGRNQLVAPTPHNQRRLRDGTDGRRVAVVAQLLVPRHQGRAVAFAPRQVEVTVHQDRRDLGRIAKDIAHAGLDHRPGEDVANDPVQHRRAGQAKANGFRLGLERIPGGIDENQPLHQRRLGESHAPRNPSAQRVAAEYHALRAERGEHARNERNVRFNGVVARRRGAGESKARQVEPDDAPRQLERVGPAVPRVQARRCAVQQHDGHRVVARALVAQVHRHAVDGEELRRRRCPRGFQ